MSLYASVLAAAGLALLAARAPAAEDDRKAIEAVVTRAYVEGVHVKGDAALMREGFHRDFRMLVLRDGVMTPVTLEEWTARVEKSARERTGPAPAIRHEFSLVDVTGNAAVARVEIHRDGRHLFTDYLSLYRFPEGWRIVAKIFQLHAGA